jgi:GH24 family phage-related lysozyme (muramidase)
MKETLNQFIERHEGRRYKVYKCSANADTIGVGHNLINGLPAHIEAYYKANKKITDDMVDELLEADIRHATADCHVLFPEFDSFSENRKFALIDFMFQLGFTKARRFVHSVACINTGRWEKAGEQMRKSAWAEQTPNRAMEIISMIEEG